MTTGEDSLLKHAPKIFTETAKIDWSKSVDDVHNLIRGLSPFPGAFTYLDGKLLKIYRSEREYTDAGNGKRETANAEVDSKEKPKMETNGKTFLKFACSNGYIIVKELQMEGKKRMTVEEFLRGYKFNEPTK
jgi:methionyl-tRNA formyltransferase